MANESLINATTQAAVGADVGSAMHAFFTVVIPEILSRFFVFIAAPFIYPLMWWLLFHLLLTFVLFELYFERHEGEDLGWSAALANSIVMIFISMELLRSLYDHLATPLAVLLFVVQDVFSVGISEKTVMVMLVILLGLLGLATAIINYFHILPRSFAFVISGHKTVNLLAYFLIVAVYRYNSGRSLPLDLLTLFSFMLFAASIWWILYVINHKRARKRAGKGNFTMFR